MTSQSSTMLVGKVIGLFVGKPRQRWPGKPSSAIAKQPAEGPFDIDADGFADDQQADLSVHGGPEKALHHYPSEHMRYWQEAFPHQSDQFTPGCFGENISTTGLTERNLCIGDVLRLGSAHVQICQGRQPCWKLNSHTGNEQMAANFQKTGQTGWYYRVLASGAVRVNDSVVLLERHHADWPLHRVIKARFDPRLKSAVASQLANLGSMSQSWRKAFAKKVDPTFSENTDHRLKGA